MSKNQIKIGVIPAGGKGRRLKNELPLATILPKPMLPLLDRPLIEHIILKMKQTGIEEVYLIVNYKKEIFRQYLGSGKKYGLKIKYIYSRPQDGLGSVINLLKDTLTEPFLVVLGDDFTQIKSYLPFTRAFFKKNALVIEAVVPENNLQLLKETCSVQINASNQILRIIEKPQNPRWKIRGCGIYVFDPLVFSYIKKTPLSQRGTKDLTQTIDLIAHQTQKAFAVPVKSNININTLHDFYQAISQILPQIKKELKK